MRPDLIACDVDGTLFDDDETITPRTRDAVRAAVAGGAHFILATGRPPRWVHPVVEALGFAPMAACANGAVIYDPATDRVLSMMIRDAERKPLDRQVPSDRDSRGTSRWWPPTRRLRG